RFPRHGRVEIRHGGRERGHHHHPGSTFRRREGIRSRQGGWTSGHRGLSRHQICLPWRPWFLGAALVSRRDREMGRGRQTLIQGERFGTTSDGETVQRFAISGGGLSAHILTWGAVVQDLRLQGHNAPLVLGFDRFEHYPE